MKKEQNIQENKLQETAGISIHIDDYDFLFSDFDPRPFSQRALSDDFLAEIKRASKEKNEEINLKFLIPKDKRNSEKEKTIQLRLKEHFKKHYAEAKKEQKRLVKQGIYFIFFGIVLMFFATLILYKLSSGFLSHFFVIILEPGGWFLFWEGLNLIIFESKKRNPELIFYEKMSKAIITFLDY